MSRYDPAIKHLDEVLSVLDRPNEGLGKAWGLQRGQAGWFHLVRARDEIARVRDALVRYAPIEGEPDEVDATMAKEDRRNAGLQ